MNESIEKLQDAINIQGETCVLTEQSPDLRFDFIDTIDIEVSPRRTQKKQKKKKKLIKPPALT